ncbi:hypothetical protein H8356DRAFT_1303507 [Neocallimastix lanati (nom. inval.)]|uniref:Uncharacterized protein n=1 Tax=Neocallimastix californiae TaxID=1754190 RepID=A0A1Y2F841_9FUNG|nr:hypothetical protein H8356DRAFT_1303507 [Neocallimastix sp. JGI-2020a]ORY80068.1 hypothetical protein LY90DRAFT_697919 [Neocallimastix californiae]|eukprot:ORY80068.1 hypothetical protein LY90DRAFT_697919 [Neocallimastix californiae]
MDGTSDNNLPDNSNEIPSHWGRGFVVLLLAFIGIFVLYIYLRRRRQNRSNPYMGEATIPLYDPLHPFSSDDDFELNAYDFEGNIPSGIGDLKLHSLEDRQTDEELNEDNAEDILKWAEENV